ncbi:MAG TPA: phosphonate metabolism protein/1,5-bisphosphokinase (PRPP-forming) PhnN [Stellaceae bacterium]|nr:phosphonate metabolism protein/1,5-bisphosphokinase (PRPP-forming) PhnN [Stellaceae bacterium]
MATARERGTLFLVVGPSGAGKDTLIAAARAALASDSGYVFPQRVITRSADSGGEAHEAVSETEFAALAAAGGFALQWSAHGLSYGIRREVQDALGAGRHVVVNVSRTVVAEARARFAPVVVVEVTADPEVLARRLAVRGREDSAAAARRLARAATLTVPPEARRIDNSGELAGAAAAFVAALRP